MFYASCLEQSKPMNYEYYSTTDRCGIKERPSCKEFLTGRQAIGPVGKNLCQATTLSGI